MDEPVHVVALSGGKDSTALALRLKELNPGQDYTYLITPTGDELPEMIAHWQRLECLLGKPMVRVTNGTLASLIAFYNALPNWRQRWCTRVLKIQPCIAYFKALPPGSVLYVGLRADEEERQGIYSTEVKTAFPLRDWGWGVRDVKEYLRKIGVRIPARTDCARCYYQRLAEWWELWKKYPDIYENACEDERRTKHTFRSETKDNWPGSLDGLRAAFEAGRRPRGIREPGLFDDDEDAPESCRVCRL